MKRAIVFIFLSLTAIFYACDKKNNSENPPMANSINPTSGGYGNELTISGSEFSSIVSENIVTIGGINADVISATSTTLTVLIPALTEGDLPVIVSTEAGVANAGLFKYAYNVYVAGSEINSDGFFVVKYWKNGVAVALSDGKSTASASAIVISGNNVYVAGNEYKNQVHTAKLWINGVESNVTNAASSGALNIFLDSNDVYIAGYVNNGAKDVATYWKNGIPVSLTDGSKTANLKTITISGGDVYAAGMEWNDSRGVAKYWKNGIPVVLTDGQKGASAWDIAVTGNDVYVCGIELENGVTTAKYWKNGVKTTLGDGKNLSFTYSMAVKGTTTHITGRENGVGRYWKNGVVTAYAQNESERTPSGVFLINDDVFIAGSVGGSTSSKAAYWKNGSEVILTDGKYDASAITIFVR